MRTQTSGGRRYRGAVVGGTRVVAAAAMVAALCAGGGAAAFAAPGDHGPHGPHGPGPCHPGHHRTPDPAGAEAPATSTVVVVSHSGNYAEVAVHCAGGHVERTLSSVGGVVATIPTSQLSRLQADRNVAVMTDVPIDLQSAAVSTRPHTPSDAFLADTGQKQVLAAGDSGAGVNVAVLDTGISNLSDFSGRLVGGVDLTGGGNPFSDGYGHGTFVAGLIAGNGASSNGAYSGEAPGAGLVSVKVAGASGQTDLFSVIAGIDWAIANRQVDNIRVLNLSLGFQPVVSALLNPLDWAVEAAWNSGIVVVTSAGNAGPFNGTIMSPGDDPLAITVGALDDMASTSPAAAEMTDFSSVGPTSPDGFMKPDLVTSGRSVVSLADPGSAVYEQNPSAVVGNANFVGSGTSFSAAITSGAVALMLSKDPSLTPDQVKARLLGNTRPGPVGNPFVDGHGALDVAAAIASAPMDYNQSTDGLTPVMPGTTVSLAPTGPADTWNPALWTGASWNGASWNGASWNGASWNGASWNGFTWNGASWNGASWNGASWNGASWNGDSWNGASWNGASWNGASWNGASWNGASWN